MGFTLHRGFESRPLRSEGPVKPPDTIDAAAPVAQLDRASVYGTEGHRFESCRARGKLQRCPLWPRFLLTRDSHPRGCRSSTVGPPANRWPLTCVAPPFSAPPIRDAAHSSCWAAGPAPAAVAGRDGDGARSGADACCVAVAERLDRPAHPSGGPSFGASWRGAARTTLDLDGGVAPPAEVSAERWAPRPMTCCARGSGWPSPIPSTARRRPRRARSRPRSTRSPGHGLVGGRARRCNGARAGRSP
jgi:hypothetical protein